MTTKRDSELHRLHEISKNQLSEIVFLDDEMKFIKSLLFKYFLPMMHDYHVNRVQLINSNLSQLHLVKANVSKDMLIHQGQLNSCLNGMETHSLEFLILSNERICDELKDLNRSFKNIKREIFTIYKDLAVKEPVGTAWVKY